MHDFACIAASRNNVGEVSTSVREAFIRGLPSGIQLVEVEGPGVVVVNATIKTISKGRIPRAFDETEETVCEVESNIVEVLVLLEDRELAPPYGDSLKERGRLDRAAGQCLHKLAEHIGEALKRRSRRATEIRHESWQVWTFL